MGKDDHYIFMDGCVVKGCKPVLDFERTFGEYAELLKELYRRGGWAWSERRFMGLPIPSHLSFQGWVGQHVHMAQSTQNIRTGADRVNHLLDEIDGKHNIHLFGTSAAGSAMLEYFLLTDPETLYCQARGAHDRTMPPQKYTLDSRIASLTIIDAPTNWVPLRRSNTLKPYVGRDSLGEYLARHTRIKAGPRTPKDQATTRAEDVPDTWIEAAPVAGLDYENRPHYIGLPGAGMERHIYTGSHMSKESREFLSRVWR